MKKSNQRRNFLKQTGLLGVASLAGMPAMAFSDQKHSKSKPYVNFIRDGLDFSTEDYAKRLVEITNNRWVEIDSYSNGGIVAELEKNLANALGKEAAVYMPTGTMANHIAIRKLSGNKPRVLVQAESHIYNDSGDTAQVLSNLNLVPLNPDQTQFTLEDVKKEVARINNGRVKTGLGAISIESPVRRTHNEVFNFEEMKKISSYARENSIGMHLDGARLFNVPAHTGKTVKEYAALFDSVYISLYKDFNAASGAILAGSAEFCKDLYHTRRMFGGSQPNAWPFAAVANEYIESFPEDYQKSLNKAEDLFKALTTDFKLEKIDNGSNVLKLHVLNADPRKTQLALLEKNIKLNNPAMDFKGFYIKINPSILRVDLKQLIKYFTEAASQ